MSSERQGFRWFGIPLTILSVVLASAAFAGGKRPFETRDSIEMSYFGTLISSQAPDLDDDGVSSPDKRWIVKVTHRGV
jgi:hypothetical protein